MQSYTYHISFYMKIAIIVRKLNVKGGVQRHALYEARELQKMGHSVTLYAFIFSREDCFAELLDGLKVVALKSKLPVYSNYFSWKAAESELSKQLALMIDPMTDILNPHDHGCYKVSYYFKKLVKNITSVWTMHDMPTRAFSAKMAEEAEPNFKTPLLKKIANYLLDKYEIGKYIKKQDIIAVLNERDKKLAKKCFGADAEIVRNGVDILSFPFSERAFPKKQTVLFMNGIFFRHRRFEDGIKAAKLLLDSGRDIFLNIAGNYNSDKRYYEELTGLARELGLPGRVCFLGRVSEGRLRELYQTSDIFLFPNHMQSWGLAVFEAMASGMPVIVSKTAGASEVLTDGKNALIVSPHRPHEITDAVRRLLDNKELYFKISREGRLFVERNMSWRRLAISYLKLFEHARKK